MRIIAGTFRGRQLKSPPSAQTRPTSDRLRETLFNVLAPRIEDVRFLDLCAGTGAVGIEALSRGAAHVTFVDQSQKMCSLIEANLDALGIPEDAADVVASEAASFLSKRAKKTKLSLTVGLMARTLEPFDIIFFDPPYVADYEEALSLIAQHRRQLLANEGLVVVEHHKKKELKQEVGVLQSYRMLRQGDSCLSFYMLKAA